MKNIKLLFFNPNPEGANNILRIEKLDLLNDDNIIRIFFSVKPGLCSSGRLPDADKSVLIDILESYVVPASNFDYHFKLWWCIKISEVVYGNEAEDLLNLSANIQEYDVNVILEPWLFKATQDEQLYDLITSYIINPQEAEGEGVVHYLIELRNVTPHVGKILKKY
jgi:hypothetical protein